MNIMNSRASYRNCIFFTTLIGISTGAVPTASGQVINEDFKLQANDPSGSDWLGTSVAIDIDIIAVGAKYDDDNGENSGSAYLFNALSGTQLAKLLPSDGAMDDLFGTSLDIDNGIVAVGSPFDDDNGDDSGSAYLFDATTGTQLIKLLPNDGTEGDQFGKSIAIDNGIVAVGAWFDDENGFSAGSAYLFDANTGTQIAKLLPIGGRVADYFGWSIAIDNNIVAVGSIGDAISGSAYLFNASTGTQIAKLLPSDGGGDFGWSIAIADDLVAVGAFTDNENGPSSGSVYLYDLSTGTHFQNSKLLPNDGAYEDRFGHSTSINDGLIAVGAIGDVDNGFLSGSAYLFDASTGVQLTKLLASDGERYDYFGWSVAINNGTIAIGAAGDDSAGMTSSGSTYIFDINCAADLTNNFALDFFDISEFLKLFAANDPAADFNNDAQFNFFDISAFLAAFAEGCP